MVTAGKHLPTHRKMVSANTCLPNAINLSQYVSDGIHLTDLTVKFVDIRL